MMKLLVLLLVAALSGCAATVLSSTERTVIVKARFQDIAEAQELANAECKTHGLYAKMSGKATINQFVFDCVP